jgi:hypothetical protein
MSCMSRGRTLPRFWFRPFGRIRERPPQHLQPVPHARRGHARDCRTARQDFGAQGRLREGIRADFANHRVAVRRERAQSVQTPAGGLAHSLADFDRDLADLVDGYLTARAVAYRRSDEGWSGGVRHGARRRIARRELGMAGVSRRGRAGSDRRRVFEPRAPLVQAAIADARAWSVAGRSRCSCRPGSSAGSRRTRREKGAYLRRAGGLRLASSRFSGWSRRLSFPALRSIHRSPPRSCACRQPTARHSRPSGRAMAR